MHGLRIRSLTVRLFYFNLTGAGGAEYNYRAFPYRRMKSEKFFEGYHIDFWKTISKFSSPHPGN